MITGPAAELRARGFNIFRFLEESCRNLPGNQNTLFAEKEIQPHGSPSTSLIFLLKLVSQISIFKMIFVSLK